MATSTRPTPPHRPVPPALPTPARPRRPRPPVLDPGRGPRPIGGPRLGAPLLAVQVVAGADGERLPADGEALLRSQIEAKVAGLLPDAVVALASPAVTGLGTIVGVFETAGDPAAVDPDDVDAALTELDLEASVFGDNLAIFGNIALLDRFAQSTRAQIDAELRPSGATVDSLRAVIQRDANGLAELVTRLEGTITTTVPDVDYVAEIRDEFHTTRVPDATVDLSPIGVFPELRLVGAGDIDFEPDTRAMVAGAILAGISGALLVALGGPGGIVALLVAGALGAEAAIVEGLPMPPSGGAGTAFAQLVQFPDILLAPTDDAPTGTRVGVSFERVTTRTDGVVVRGKLAAMPREPRISFVTPSQGLVMPGDRSLTKDVHATLRDLRGTVSHSWSSSDATLTRANQAVVRATFPLPDLDPGESVVRHLTLAVVDDDGFEVTRTFDFAVEALDQATLDTLGDGKPDVTPGGEQP